MSEITEQVRERIRNGTRLSQFFPLRTPENVLFRDMRVHCRGCRAELPDRDTSFYAHHPIASVTVLEGYGVCRSCRSATPLHLRIQPDGRVQQHTRRGWIEYAPSQPTNPRPAWWDLLGWLRRITST